MEATEVLKKRKNYLFFGNSHELHGPSKRETGESEFTVIIVVCCVSVSIKLGQNQRWRWNLRADSRIRRQRKSGGVGPPPERQRPSRGTTGTLQHRQSQRHFDSTVSTKWLLGFSFCWEERRRLTWYVLNWVGKNKTPKVSKPVIETLFNIMPFYGLSNDTTTNFCKKLFCTNLRAMIRLVEWKYKIMKTNHVG